MPSFMNALPAQNPVAPSRPSSEQSIFEQLDNPSATATLPSLKSVLSELETLTLKSNIRLDKVTQLVQVDQGMSLRVLRMANSVYYSPSEPIMDVQDAILYIGLSTFRGAVVSTRCIEKTCHIKQSVLDWKEFWIHAAGVGHLSMELASHMKSAALTQESYYLMGLLHDIGKVVLAHVSPGQFNKIYLQAGREKKAPSPLEQEYLGIDHGHLGAWYLEKQGIPVALCEPVRFHHGPVFEDKPHLRNALLIRLADQLALHSQLGQSGNYADMGDPFDSEEWAAYLAHCQLDGDEAKALKENLIGQVSRICDLVRKIIV
jgi:HD-like signal output (HDOD) protein